MSKLSNINYSKISNSTYLSNCDLINKYNLLSLSKTPKVKEIILELSSRDVLNAFENMGKAETDPETQIKSFFILYIIQAFSPFIMFSSSTKTESGKHSFLLRTILSNPDDLCSFLTSFFVENWNKLILEDFKFFEEKNDSIEIFKSNQKNVILSRTVPSDIFFEVEAALNRNLLEIAPRNIQFKIKFLFQNNNFKIQKTSKKMIKNLPLFWISG